MKIKSYSRKRNTVLFFVTLAVLLFSAYFIAKTASLNPVSLPFTDFYESRAFQSAFLQEVRYISDYAKGIEINKKYSVFRENTPISLSFSAMTSDEMYAYFNELADAKGDYELQLNISENAFQNYALVQQTIPEEIPVYPIYTKKDIDRWLVQGVKESRREFYVYYLMHPDGHMRYRYSTGEGASGKNDEEEMLREVRTILFINELVAPIGYDSLLDLANAENQDLEMLNQRVIDAFSFLEIQLENAEGFETNLGYYYEDAETGKVYQNMNRRAFRNAEWTDSVLQIADGKAVVTNGMMKRAYEKVAEKMNTLHLLLPDNTTLRLDKRMAITDDLSIARDNYMQSQLQYWIAIPLFVLSLISVLASFVRYLIHTQFSDDRRVTRLEKSTPGEMFFVALFAGLFFLVFYLPRYYYKAYMYYGAMIRPEDFLILFLFLLLGAILRYLFGVLARKLKDRSLYDGSLLHITVDRIGETWFFFRQGRHVNHRLLLIYLVWIGISLFLLLLWPTLFAVFLILLAGLIFVIREEGQLGLIWNYMMKNGEKEEFPNRERMKGRYLEISERLSHFDEKVSSALNARLKSERLQTELITNVSHDLRTPLTSIINYNELLMQEGISEKERKEYLCILNSKAKRLKQILNDLIEVSRASSGAVELDIQRLSYREMVIQTMAEYEDLWQEIPSVFLYDLCDDPVYILADGSCLSRVLDNVMDNALKYSQPGTRIYLSLTEDGVFELKNTSKSALNMDPDEMMERFKRGDLSRSTEGSGLGLSIARSLTHLMKGDFSISIDGDLFKVRIRFEKETPN